MFISTDSGEYKWTARSCSTTIQDFAVESASIVYVAGTANSIVKSTNGAFTWGPPVNTNIALYATNNLYSISVVAAGKVMVGGTGGSVAYSTDSGDTWTALPRSLLPRPTSGLRHRRSGHRRYHLCHFHCHRRRHLQVGNRHQRAAHQLDSRPGLCRRRATGLDMARASCMI